MPEVRADRGRDCPLHKKDMSEVCHKCPWWFAIKGKNPQTSDDVESWSCAISWLPYLLIENSQQQRTTADAINLLRKDVSAQAPVQPSRSLDQALEVLRAAAGIAQMGQLQKHGGRE